MQRYAKEKLHQISDMARLSRHAYSDQQRLGPAKGWTMVQESTAQPDSITKRRDDGFYGALYKKNDASGAGPLYTFSFRGTDGHSDLSSLFAIAIGKTPPQFYRAMDFVMAACKREGISPKNVSFTGHSLGGYLARTVGLAFGASNIFTFNSPGPSRYTRALLETLVPEGHLPLDRTIHVKSKNDIVGLLGFPASTLIELDTKVHHHAIDTIQQGIARLLRERPLTNAVIKKKDFLADSFNRACEKLSASAILQRALKKLAGYVPSDDTPEPQRALRGSR